VTQRANNDILHRRKTASFFCVGRTVGASTPFLRDFAVKAGGLDAVFYEFNLLSTLR